MNNKYIDLKIKPTYFTLAGFYFILNLYYFLNLTKCFSDL